MRLLVVDDSAPMRTFIRRVAKSTEAGIAEIIEAVDGKDALAKLREQQVDVICTDANMAVMGGAELIEKLVAWPEMWAVPVVVISSAAPADKAEEMLRLGAAGYIHKPLSVEALQRELVRARMLSKEMRRWQLELGIG